MKKIQFPYKLVYYTSLCIIPPSSQWDQIQEIRKLHDKSFERWMPHINIFFPFYKENHFPEVKQAFERELANMDSITVDLGSLSFFEKEKTCVLYAKLSEESENKIKNIYSILRIHGQELGKRDEFTPHLTLGQFQKNRIEKMMTEIGKSWKPVSFKCEKLMYVTRNGDEAFKVFGDVSLGNKSLKSVPKGMQIISNKVSREQKKEKPHTLLYKEGRSFQVRHLDTKGKEYDFRHFMDETRSQFEQFFRESVRVNEKKKDKREFEVLDVKEILTEGKFNNFCETAKKMNTEYFPTLTYHGTSSPSIVNSICKYGYLAPGEIHPGKGYVRSIYNGNYFGDGIYTSSKMEISSWYGYIDKNQNFQLIVNACLLGNVFWFTENDYFGVMVPMDGKYSNTYNTLATYNLNVTVSGSGDYVVPLFVVTIKPSFGYKIHDNMIGNSISSWRKEYFRNMDTKNMPKIKLCKIVNDLYTIEVIKKEKVCTKKKKRWDKAKYFKGDPVEFRMQYLFPTSYQKHKNFEFFSKMFVNFIDSSVTKHKILYFYGETVHSARISVGSSFNNMRKNVKYEDKDKTLKALDQALKKATSGNDTNFFDVIYLFIYRKEDDDIYKKEFEDLVKKYEMFTKVKNIVIKIVVLNEGMKEKEIIEKYCKLKTKFQRQHFYERSFQTLKNNKLTDVFDDLLEENENIIDDDINFDIKNLKIPYPYGTNGEGFVKKLYECPHWEIKDESEIPLYKGDYIKFIYVNNEAHFVEFCEKINLKLAAKMVIKILSEFRNYLLLDGDSKRKFKMYENTITLMCEGILDVINKELKNISVKKESKDLIKTVRSFFFKITTILGEIKTLSGANFSGKWFDQLNGMKYSKNILKRVKGVNFKKEKIMSDLEITEEQMKKLVKEPADALALYQAKGRGIMTHSSSASQVEPWLLIVKYVSTTNEKFPANLIYNAHEFGIKLFDGNKKRVNDILVDYEDYYKEVTKMLFSFTFTRNPYLYIGTQNHALMTITTVSLIEQIFMKFIKGEVKEINEEIMKEFEIVLDYLNKTKMLLLRNNVIKNTIKMILNEMNGGKEFEKCFTEQNEIVSICMVLGSLILPSAKEIFKNEDDYSRICFGLMAECIMRGCRSFLRSSKIHYIGHARHVLGMKNDDDIEKYKFDIKKAQRRTGKFYLQRFSNCSPFALVGFLEFIERYHKGNYPLRKIDEDFFDKTISMRNFLKRHLKGEKGSYTQVALFLQGIKLQKSKQRQNLHFKDPKKIIDDIINEQLLIIKRSKEMEYNENRKKKIRRMNLIQRAQEYIIYHQVPKLFSFTEVNELNLKRPDNDQLELTRGNLLKHHCCYPDCPFFLQNFCTKKDKKYGTRWGLYNHLKYNQNVLDNYVPSFHTLSRDFLMRDKNMTFDDYSGKIKSYYLNDLKGRRWWKSFIKKEETLKSTYEFYKQFR